jgi:hypothetical protein
MTARAASPPPDQPPPSNRATSKDDEVLAESTDVNTVNTDATTATATATATANNKTANHVYIFHPEHSWIPAQVVERPSPKSAVVSIPQYLQEQAIVCDGGRTARSWDQKTIQLLDDKNQTAASLPMQNVDPEGRLQVVEDMVDLPFLHEVCTNCIVCLFCQCV